jgi:hypothetical protein
MHMTNDRQDHPQELPRESTVEPATARGLRTTAEELLEVIERIVRSDADRSNEPLTPHALQAAGCIDVARLRQRGVAGRDGWLDDAATARLVRDAARRDAMPASHPGRSVLDGILLRRVENLRRRLEIAAQAQPPGPS